MDIYTVVYVALTLILLMKQLYSWSYTSVTDVLIIP